ncbi:GFA family protein [Bradyrhizobium sp. LjRoot220]|uniref:GFA family protein n=1 Tax=Bradyrhizobium sp. LjRoot220 TaxID=3342284 RepID=UPI003F500089
MLAGRCLCGACTYTIEGDPVVVAHCHCRDCQRFSGAGHTSGAMFAESGVSIAGNPARFILTSEAGNTVTRLFCGECGSPLFGSNSGMPGFMTVDGAPLTTSLCRARPHALRVPLGPRSGPGSRPAAADVSRSR